MHAHRTPIWGLGCAGGVSGLARAAEAATVRPGRSVLLVAVELCSLTFQRDDLSKSNLVGISLFADGAAAAVLQAGPGEEEKEGPVVVDSYSRLMPDSADVMGWDVVAGGLKVRFSRSIPAIVGRDLPDLIDEACDAWGIGRADLQHFVAHPGGAKVLEAYAASLGLEADRLQASWEVLRTYGNMSSPTAFFVLEEHMRTTPPTGAPGVLLALGPGFSAEQVLFRW
jgi:alkylresorcinol/alkylpyrone synthase